MTHNSSLETAPHFANDDTASSYLTTHLISTVKTLSFTDIHIFLLYSGGVRHLKSRGNSYFHRLTTLYLELWNQATIDTYIAKELIEILVVGRNEYLRTKP